MTPQEIEQQVQANIEKFGFIKVNLIHKDGMSEGIWATPIDEESAKKANDNNSRKEKIQVQLCNQPLGWNGKKWGDIITVITQGSSRPQAR